MAEGEISKEIQLVISRKSMYGFKLHQTITSFYCH